MTIHIDRPSYLCSARFIFQLTVLNVQSFYLRDMEPFQKRIVDVPRSWRVRFQPVVLQALNGWQGFPENQGEPDPGTLARNSKNWNPASLRVLHPLYPFK